MRHAYIRIALIVLILIGGISYFLFTTKQTFIYGLDLAGGSALSYTIETSKLPTDVVVEEQVAALRDVVERRVNLFGVREPVVTTEYARLSKEWRLSIELPGVTNLKEAEALIGDTPVLEFRVLSDKKANEMSKGETASSTELLVGDFVPTALTGSYLKKSTLVFDPTTQQPVVELQFNDEGAKLFAELTKANIGKQIAIYLDGYPVSAPVVNEEITGGKAIISGKFSVEEAKTLVGRLNSGALPVPITLASTSVVPPSLGAKAVHAGEYAGLLAFVAIAVFMILWYRLPGLLAVLALCSYVVASLALFKVIPVTLTAAGIAGFIISIGIAIDANILVFERMKEELRGGKGLHEAIEVGFARAWTSIRDSHIASIIVSLVLFWLGTSVVKGFAFTFFLGAVTSLISAQFVTRAFLRAIAPRTKNRFVAFLFGSGFIK